MAKTKKSDQQQQQELPKRIMDKLPTGWSDSANSMKEDELKRVIFECEGNLWIIESDRENDGPLQSAREKVKELGASYREAAATQKAKIRYALWLLEGRGYDLDKTEDAA